MYIVKCGKCGKSFTKKSASSREDRCDDCKSHKYKRKNRYFQMKVAEERAIEKNVTVHDEIKRLQTIVGDLERTQEYSFDAIEMKMSESLRELGAEVIEAYLSSVRKEITQQHKRALKMIEREFEKIREEVRNSLVVINTRTKKTFDAVNHDIEDIMEHVGIRLNKNQQKHRDRRYGRGKL